MAAARVRSGGRPTLEEVAARAGVGRGTASRVINGSPRVSDATREAVEAAVAELGYVPNRAARALAGNRTDAIALVVPEPETRFFAEPYFSAIVRGVGAALADTEMQLLLTLVGNDRERRRLAQYLTAHRVDGVLLVAVHADDPLPELLEQLGMPCVISGARHAAETLPSVDSDNFEGARAAVDHLVARGRRQVATITGRLEVYGAQRRLDGYRAALSAGRPGPRRTPHRPRRLHRGGRGAGDARPPGPSPRSGRGLRRLRRDTPHARQVLREADRRIPEDVALIGFDDSVVARHMHPPLTSVRQPIEEMGRRMAQLLLDEIAGRAPGDERPSVVLPTELVVRDSS